MMTRRDRRVFQATFRGLIQRNGARTYHDQLDYTVQVMCRRVLSSYWEARFVPSELWTGWYANTGALCCKEVEGHFRERLTKWAEVSAELAKVKERRTQPVLPMGTAQP